MANQKVFSNPTVIKVNGPFPAINKKARPGKRRKTKKQKQKQKQKQIQFDLFGFVLLLFPPLVSLFFFFASFS